MESITFDRLTRRLSDKLTRRGALRSLVASAVAVTGSSVLLQTDDATARRRRRHKTREQRRHRDWCGRQGDGCGALDADSGEFTAPYCCHGYYCHYEPNGGTWTCRAE